MLDYLKSTFDEGDLEQLKAFVRRNLSNPERAYLKFESGRTTSKSHLAAIIKMAIELKKLTATNPQSDSDEEDNPQQSYDSDWQRFCDE